MFHAYKHMMDTISKHKYYAEYLHLYTYYVYIDPLGISEATPPVCPNESAAETM